MRKTRRRRRRSIWTKDTEKVNEAIWETRKRNSCLEREREREEGRGRGRGREREERETKRRER